MVGWGGSHNFYNNGTYNDQTQAVRVKFRCGSIIHLNHIYKRMCVYIHELEIYVVIKRYDESIDLK